MLTTKAPPGAFPRLVHTQTGHAHSIPKQVNFALQTLWAAYIPAEIWGWDGGEGRGSLPSPAFAALLRCRGWLLAERGAGCRLAASSLLSPATGKPAQNLWVENTPNTQTAGEKMLQLLPSPSPPSPPGAGGSLPPLSPQTACKLHCQPQPRSCFLWFFAANS